MNCFDFIELSGEEYEGDTTHPGNGFDSDINDVDEETFDDMPLAGRYLCCVYILL